tara:strand:- start:34 stop:1176 length:1143 start_codon:yes stop_codon:yes gene_type:complete
MDSKDLKHIAQVYEAVYGGVKKEKKGLVVTNADKKANTKAYQNYKAGVKGYTAADHMKEGKAESPEAKEEKDKKDDDLAGAPNGKGKKKAKRWWDDDGDGKGYEEGEVDGKFPNKKKVKEEVAPRTQKGAMAYDGPNKERSEAADRVAAKKKKGHDCASKVKHEEYGMGECIKEMHTLDEDGNVSHYDVLFGHGLEKNVEASSLEIIEGMYHEHVVNDEKNSEIEESIDDEYIETVQKVKAAELEADIKRWGALKESGKFTVEELESMAWDIYEGISASGYARAKKYREDQAREKNRRENPQQAEFFREVDKIKAAKAKRKDKAEKNLASNMKKENYQAMRNPEKAEKEDKRSSREKRMADPKKGIDSPAFKEFMRQQGM